MPNQSPILLNPIPDQILEINELFCFTFFNNSFNDPDGDKLTYVATLADGSPLPDWLHFNPRRRTFNGMPSTEDTLTIRVEANDNKGKSVSGDFDLTIVGETLEDYDNWISVPNIFQQTISFENPVTSTNTVQEVTITSAFDPDFDWDSFSLDQFGWGDFVLEVPEVEGQSYSERLDLTAEFGFLLDLNAEFDTATGNAIWRFTTIDPATGQLPIDPTLGFLAPNNIEGIGEGFISYTIATDDDLETGDILYAQANVIFDAQYLVETPTIFNIADADAPVSSVSVLPENIDDPNFLVNWSGTDEGSGIASYDIYVSIDGQPFELWLDDTVETSATYDGNFDTSYSFYSIATDNAGNTEVPPIEIDSSTTVNSEPIAEADVDFGEYGEIQALNHNWQNITLDRSYINPVIIVSDPTLNGVQPATVRLRNITGNSFQVRIQEPNYLDDIHLPETVSYVVVEAGDWELADGTRISAGLQNSNLLSPQGFTDVALTEFDQDLTVLTQVQTYNGPSWVTTRTRDITSSGFSFTMQEEENLNNGNHATESIGWLAIEQGVGQDQDSLLYGGLTERMYDEQPQNINFGSTFTQGLNATPIAIAKLGSSYGLNTANVRLSGISDTGFGVRVYEEQSLDLETDHTSEEIAFLAFGNSSGLLTGSFILNIAYLQKRC